MEKTKTYIIRTGTKHYALYLVLNIATCKHIANLEKTNYDNKLQARIEFKRMLAALHSPDDKYSVEFKE